jgi:hypothetical protein
VAVVGGALCGRVGNRHGVGGSDAVCASHDFAATIAASRTRAKVPAMSFTSNADE